MFYWFLKDYETKIFKANDRKLKTFYTWEKVLLFSFIALLISWLFISLYQPENPMGIIILIGSIGLIIAIYFLEENRRKKEFDRIVERFKKNKLEPFISMLQDKKYTMFGKSLDSKEGIEWLLNACSTEIERYKNKPSLVVPIKSFIFTLILPIVTYIGGTFAATLSNSERIYFSVMVLMILLMIFGIYCSLALSLNDFLSKKIRVIEDLKDNLEYYKLTK